MRSGTIAQIEVDETLIRNPDVFGYRLEIGDGVFVEPNGDLLLQL
jgi:hypothetical protein